MCQRVALLVVHELHRKLLPDGRTKAIGLECLENAECNSKNHLSLSYPRKLKYEIKQDAKVNMELTNRSSDLSVTYHSW